LPDNRKTYEGFWPRFLQTAEKHKKRIFRILLAGLIIDAIKDHVRTALMDWTLSNFGWLGRWLYENPLSVLTICTVSVILWMIFAALEMLKPTESGVMGPSGEPLYRTRINPAFVYQLSVAAVAVSAFIVYGHYHYIKSPQVYIAPRDAYFDLNYMNTDLHPVVNMKNYGTAPAQVSVSYSMYCLGESCSGQGVDTVWHTSVGPLGVFSVSERMQIMNLDDPTDTQFLYLYSLFKRGEIMFSVVLQYNDGKRDVTYKWEGTPVERSIDLPSCPPPRGCKGVMGTVLDERN
jgi:hypothetical protein